MENLARVKKRKHDGNGKREIKAECKDREG